MKRKKLDKSTQEDSMVSIIIRNRNEREFIGFAIQSCIDHFTNPEIIIIDNHSTDDSLEVVNLFNNRVDLRMVHIDDYTPGKSINLGVKESKYDTILVLSAHSQITQLPHLDEVKSMLDKNVAVFGKQTPIYRGKKITPRYIWSHFIDEEVENMYSSIEDRYFLHNAFCFYKKEFLSNNPFDETLPGKEDRYWAIDIVEKGHKFSYNPQLQCNHYWTSNGATWKGLG